MFDSDGNTIKWNYFKKLVTCQYQYGLHAGTKIRKHHKKNFQTGKIKVRLAIQLLSYSISNALNFLRTIVKIPEFADSLGTEKFSIMMNNIFDLLNSRRAFVKIPSKSPINRNNIIEVRLKVLEYENYIRSLHHNEKSILETKRKLGFYGLIVLMQSCIAIFDKYASFDESPSKYLLTYKLS